MSLRDDMLKNNRFRRTMEENPTASVADLLDAFATALNMGADAPTVEELETLITQD